MAAQTLVKDALYRVSVLLQDDRPNQFVRWTGKELITWMNDGQLAIAKYLPIACSRIDTIKLVAGTRQSIASIEPTSFISGDGGAQPSQAVIGLSLNDIIRNMGADGSTPGSAIRIIPREVQDNIASDWHKSARSGKGEVEHFVFDERMPRTFYVVPGIGSVPTWVEIAYVASPIGIPIPSPDSLYGVFGSSTAVIGISDVYLDELVNYVVARAYMKDSEYGDPKNAQLYSQMFVSSINALAQLATGQNPNLSFLPFAPQYPAASR